MAVKLNEMEKKIDRTCTNNCSDVCGECQIPTKKMEKKMTACSWLIEQITSLDITNISDEQWFGIIGEAKQLEKQQIVQSYLAGDCHNKTPEQYYTETYESPKRDRSGKA